jgi:ComF family protein
MLTIVACALFEAARISFYNSCCKGRWVFSSSRRKAIANFGLLTVRTTSHALFSLFFPDECRVCGEPLREVTRIPVCRRCLRAPQPLSAEFFCVSCRTPFQNAFPLDADNRCALCRGGLRGFDAAYCFGAYEGVLRELIHLFKYARIKTLAHPLGDLLAAALPRDQEWDALVPVPLHWRRQWKRGFNQSELLARDIARRTAIPVVKALRRAHATLTQAGLSNTNRRQNVAKAFRCRLAAEVAGKRILLIDDVMTTGATGAACALALKRAGARKVALLAVARVDRRMDGARFLVPQSAALQPGVLQPAVLQSGVL